MQVYVRPPTDRHIFGGNKPYPVAFIPIENVAAALSGLIVQFHS